MSGPCGRATNKGLPAPNLEEFSLLETFSSRRWETVGKYTRSTHWQVVDYSKQGQTKQFTLLHPLSMEVSLSFTHRHDVSPSFGASPPPPELGRVQEVKVGVT